MANRARPIGCRPAPATNVSATNVFATAAESRERVAETALTALTPCAIRRRRLGRCVRTIDCATEGTREGRLPWPRLPVYRPPGEAQAKQSEYAMDVRSGFIDSIGNTPLIKLIAASEATGCNIYGKAEFLNPGGSVKDRAELAIIEDAEKRGQLKPVANPGNYVLCSGTLAEELAAT